jgi:PIN domain nuclease of toxin-antitoxin system
VSSGGYVLDASAVLCLLFDEPGADRVEALLPGAKLGVINYHEVIAKLIDRGVPPGEVVEDLSRLEVEIIPADQQQAELAGLMRETTRAAGLSLADRACLALALRHRATAVTADRAWTKVDVGVAVDVVR